MEKGVEKMNSINNSWYCQLFQNLFRMKVELEFIKDSKSNEVEKLYLSDFREYPNIIANIRTCAGRVVKGSEVIYRFMEKSDKKSINYIPQKELKEILKNEKFLKLFTNVDKVVWSSFTIVLKEKKEVQYNFLDYNLLLGHGDYGKGVYFNIDREEFTKDKKGIYFRIQSAALEKGKYPEDILKVKYVWSNEALFAFLFNKMRNEFSKLNIYTEHITGIDGRNYRIGVYPWKNNTWKEVVWQGKIMNIRQPAVDIVIGPKSGTFIDVISERMRANVAYYRSLKSEQGIKDEKVFFMEYLLENEDFDDGIQMCIYNKEVLNSFILK